MATWSKARICDRSVFGIAGSNPAKRHECLSLMSVVCCQVKVSASGRSLVQRSPTECGVSERDREASIKRRPWPTKGCQTMVRKTHRNVTHAAYGQPSTKVVCAVKINTCINNGVIALPTLISRNTIHMLLFVSCRSRVERVSCEKKNATHVLLKFPEIQT